MIRILLFAALAVTGCGNPTPPPPDEITGTVDNYALFESAYVDARNVDVWLPPGYDASDTAYPVIYMHDGQNLFNPAQSYIGVDWGMDEAMTAFADSTSGTAIVVGVWNTPKRFEEYMPAGMAERMPEAPDVPLESDAYLRFLTEELKPFVDATYRTRPGREHTMVMGSSMGGLISLYAFVEYPDVFGGAACVSTHWPAPKEAAIAYLLDRLPAPGGRRLYFDYGTEALDAQYEPYQLQVDAVMEAAGYSRGRDWVTYRFDGADHSERAWRARVHVPVAFLLGD